MKIAVAGTGYVGLSIATLLAQHNEVVAVDVIPEKVAAINARKSPIRDEYIERFFAEKSLNLKVTLDASEAYSDADYVVVAIYIKRPQKIQHMNERQNTHQGYLAEVNGTNLKITYLYDENNAVKTEYYIDFILLPKEILEGVEDIDVAVEPRLEPVPNIATEYDN